MHAARAVYAPVYPAPAKVLTWLLEVIVKADGRHRERCRLTDLTDDRLRDMGLPRRELPFSLPAADLR